MEPGYEKHYHRVEASHWWFCSRRQIVTKLVTQCCSDRASRILDIGCSSGLLLQELMAHGYQNVEGVDSSSAGIALCRQAGIRAQSMDAHRLAYADGYFDCVTASDVLEHLEHDAAALAEWRRVLQPGGALMIFVPAFMWLWTRHDTINWHFRRYSLPQIVRLLVQCGFGIERSSYWNTALFLPVALLRLWRRCRGEGTLADNNPSDMVMPPPFLNGLLSVWMGLENRLHGWGLNSPVGVSVMVVARRAEN